VPNLASQMRVAFSKIVSNTRSKLSRAELIMRNTSAVATCSWRASASSRLTRATSDSWLAADELRGRDASVPLGRFGAAGLRRRDLTGPALERPRMAFPEAQEAHGNGSKDAAQGRVPAIERLAGYPAEIIPLHRKSWDMNVLTWKGD
jgi:hypothetical protein